MKNKITSVHTQIITFVETNEIGFTGQYQRISATEWLNLEGGDWLEVNQYISLENDYQEYIKKGKE